MVTRAAFALLLSVGISFHALANDTSLYQNLAKYFHDHSMAVGIIGSVYEGGVFHDFNVGYSNLRTEQALEKDTFFELGSATKVFTGMLLARNVVLGDLQLDQPVEALLPQFMGSDVGSITLLELSTHTSGLTRMPDNQDDSEPYTTTALLEYLSTAEVFEKTYHYSNTGVALLTLILEQVNGMSFAAMVETFILQPLAIDGIELQWSPALEMKMSRKYNSIFEEESYWSDLQAMNGTGVIKVSLAGMKSFMKAMIHADELPYPLDEAVKLAQTPQVDAERFHVGLGWFADTINDAVYLNHNGSTEGFTVEFLFDRQGQRGFIYLSNTDLLTPGLCLVDVFTSGACTLPESPAVEDEDRFLGSFQAVDEDEVFSFSIKKSDRVNALYISIPGDINRRLFLENDGRLQEESGHIVVRFETNDVGTLIEDWYEGDPESYPFTRVSNSTENVNAGAADLNM